MRVRVGVLLVAILAVLAAPTFAQVTGAVKGGVNFSKTVFEDADGQLNTGQKPGLVIGAAVDVPIATTFSFSPEFLYSMKGGKGGDFESDNVKFKLDQVQIPLLFKAKFSPMASVRPFISIGPAIGFTTAAKFEDEFEEEDIKDEVETVDFSGVIGAGVQLGRGIVEVRYDHGFRDLDKQDGSEAKLKTFSILFGVGFGG